MTSLCQRGRTRFVSASHLVARALLSIACMAGMQSTAVANLITDPGFESAASNVYSTGAIGDGWNVIQGSIDVLNNSQGFGTSHSGQQFADLDFAFAVNELSQTFATVIGQTYAVSFWLSDDVGGNSLSVNFGSRSLLNGPTPALGRGNYQLRTFNVVATTSSTSLTFTSQYLFSGTGVGAVIDDVDVAAVPEPAAWTIGGVGVLGLLGIRRALPHMKKLACSRSGGVGPRQQTR